MTCQDYKNLIDRGWRRSGKYVYKPIMKRSCCPPYAIRCDTTNFSISKSQKKVLKKVHRYLATGQTRLLQEEVEEEKHEKTPKQAGTSPSEKSEPGLAAASLPSKPSSSKPSSGADPSKSKCRKAKEVRREKWALKGKTPVVTRPKKTVEDFIENEANDSHKLTVELLPCSMKNDVFKASFMESYSVYVKYQVAVHGDEERECTQKQFSRFLVDSPLVPYQPEGGPPSGYGSFHQHYRIDGKLVAVGVLDILPTCTSSVYFYYDPSYEFLTLGTYSALREIYFTRQLQKQAPDLAFYYMGYYVHSCAKMRYKGQYNPSFLLCPEVYSWIPIEISRPKLDASKYSRLDSSDAVEEDVAINNVLVLWQRTAMPYEIFVAMGGGDGRRHEASVREYAQLAGPKASASMLLYLD
ncbi:arginyl-tRNA--protein transferase 1-like isoform X3 [Oscarella lobularis]